MSKHLSTAATGHGASIIRELQSFCIMYCCSLCIIHGGPIIQFLPQFCLELILPRGDDWTSGGVGQNWQCLYLTKRKKKPMCIFACLQNVNTALKVSNLDLTMYLLYKTQKGTIWCFLNEVCLHQIKLWAVWLQRNKLEQEKVKFSIFIVCKLCQVSEVRRLALMQLRNLNWISEDQNAKQKFVFGIWICKVRQWLARIFNLQNISHWWHWSWF